MGLGGWTYTGYIARYALGGMDVPGLGFRFAEATRGPSVPVGRDGVFEAFVPPYHDDMGAAVDAFLERKWSQYESDKPKAYLEPDRVTSPDRAPGRGHDPDRQGLLPVRARHLRALPGATSTRCTSGSPARPSTSTRTSTPSYYPPGALTDQHHAHFERWHPEMAGDDGRRRPLHRRGPGPRGQRRQGAGATGAL